jgi:hypothetical protein
MRRITLPCITDMHDIARSCAASRDSSDKSSDVVSAALLKFVGTAARLGYSEAGALWLFGRLMATCSDRRRRRITRKQAFRRVERLALAVALVGGAP